MKPHSDLYTRLKPSKIDKGGIGVFAIVSIRKGTYIFGDECVRRIKVKKTDLSKIRNLAIRKMYDDFSIDYGSYVTIPYNLNMLTQTDYVNHSNDPNVELVDEFDFVAIRNIKIGEELAIDYRKSWAKDQLWSERSPRRNPRRK